MALHITEDADSPVTLIVPEQFWRKVRSADPLTKVETEILYV